MAKHGTAKKDRQNTTWATQVLREDHERIRDLFAEFDDPAEKDRKGDIADTAAAEIRLHRALVEEILIPAVRAAAGDPGALSEVLDEMEGWEALLEAVERRRPEDPAFAKAWKALRAELERHLKQDHQGLLELARTLPLDYVALGLRMGELRRQITAERPTASKDTSN